MVWVVKAVVDRVFQTPESPERQGGGSSRANNMLDADGAKIRATARVEDQRRDLGIHDLGGCLSKSDPGLTHVSGIGNGYEPTLE